MCALILHLQRKRNKQNQSSTHTHSTHTPTHPHITQPLTLHKMTAFLDCLWWINIGASSFQWRISDTVYSIFVSHSIGGSVMVFLHKSVRNQNNRAAASDVDAFLLNAVQDNKCIRCVKIFNAHCSIGCANVSFCVMYYMCTIAVHNV